MNGVESTMQIPTKYFVTSGSSEGETELTAFDGALLKANIGNVNLVKVSSILPPGSQYIENPEFPPGALVHTAFGTIVSTEPGTVISAAVAAGVSEDSFGMIMELVGKTSKEEAEEKIIRMLKESFQMRGLELKSYRISSVEHTVTKIGCAVAAVPIW